MKLGFILFIGVFTNLLLASIFPYQLLPTDHASSLVGSDSYGYNFGDSEFFGSNQKATTGSLVEELEDKSGTTDLLATSTTESDLLGGIGFFDGLFDALSKAATYVSLIVPFSGVLFLLPGALGLILGGIYSLVTIYAIIRFIRGA